MMLSLWPLAAVLLALSATSVAAQDAEHASSGEFNRALGVECDFCHAPPGTEEERPARATARRMVAMVAALNQRLESRGGQVACWTCHAGARVPSRIERAAWERFVTAWPRNAAPASDDVKLAMAVYTASVGRTCAGCHERNGTGPATDEAVALVRTMTGLFAVMKDFLPPTARTQCFMCHKGRPHPQVRPLD
jgi:cytochrome c553